MGRSPNFNDGRNQCFAGKKILVAKDAAVAVDVLCYMR
jgi:hypothetical protein